MKGPQRLVEQNELFARLVDAAQSREPRPERLKKLLDVLEAPAPVAGAPLRTHLRLRAPDLWICTAVVAASGLAVLSYGSGEREEHSTVVAAATTHTQAPRTQSAAPERSPETVPSFAVADLPDSKNEGSRKRPVAPRIEASPSSPSSTTAAKPSIGRELDLITRAREALTKGDARACLAAVALHDVEFPSGQFVLEAEVMRIEATHANGDRAAARTIAHAFLAKSPQSPYAARIRSFLKSLEQE